MVYGAAQVFVNVLDSECQNHMNDDLEILFGKLRASLQHVIEKDEDHIFELLKLGENWHQLQTTKLTPHAKAIHLMTEHAQDLAQAQALLEQCTKKDEEDITRLQNIKANWDQQTSKLNPHAPAFVPEGQKLPKAVWVDLSKLRDGTQSNPHSDQPSDQPSLPTAALSVTSHLRSQQQQCSKCNPMILDKNKRHAGALPLAQGQGSFYPGFSVLQMEPRACQTTDLSTHQSINSSTSTHRLIDQPIIPLP